MIWRWTRRPSSNRQRPPRQVAELLIAAVELERETHALAAELGPDAVIRFALLVCDGVRRVCADHGSPAADAHRATAGT